MMTNLSFPLQLSDEVHIMYKTNEGCYIIMYKKADGNNSIIYLPDSCNSYIIGNTKGDEAIKLVTDFLAASLQEQ